MKRRSPANSAHNGASVGLLMPLMAIIIRLTHSFEYRIMAVRLAALSAAAVCGYRFGCCSCLVHARSNAL